MFFRSSLQSFTDLRVCIWSRGCIYRKTTADMLNLPTPEAHYEVIKTLPSEEQKEILKSLSERADDVRNRVVESDEDNMLKITNNGKKLALDQRLINPLLPDNPDSKVNVCVKNVFSIWDKTNIISRS